MNRNNKKTIEAIAHIETGCFDKKVSPPWIISKSDDWFTDVRIYSGTSDEEIGLVMFKACSPTTKEIIMENASETLEAFVADEGFVLSGGLVFKENNQVKVSPSCCCGLEGWDEWFTVANGNCQIWNGHDPDALVEIDDGMVKIWQDIKTKDENYSIEFSVEEMIENLRNVERDLTDFLSRLAEWTRKIDPALEKEVVSHFAKNMHIEIWAEKIN